VFVKTATDDTNEGTEDMPRAATKVTNLNGKKRHKSFNVINIDDAEPLTFDLGGEEFACYAEVQGKTILDIMRVAAEGDEDTRGVMMAVSVLDFFVKVMPPTEYERFEKLMEDEKRIVPMDVLSEIMGWLIEEYTDRPTKPSSDS
jgi:hypothetical protein